MLISIIIPVYNVEKYICDCLDSIIKQNTNNFEIILVDDGSTDHSSEICDRYAFKYSFVRTIHKANGGLSDARNVGIKKAIGDYILFIDSDDFIADNAIIKLEKFINSLDISMDIVFLDAFKVYANGRVEPMNDGYIVNKINGKSKQEVMIHIAELPKFPGSACTKMISRKLIIDNHLFFEKGLLSEDIDWTIRLLLVAKKFSYLRFPYYFYRQNREGSITNTICKKRVDCILEIIEKWSKKEEVCEFQSEINTFMAYEYIVLLYNYALLEKIERKEMYNRIKKNKWVMQYSRTKKENLVYLFTNTLGINITAKLLKLYYERREG